MKRELIFTQVAQSKLLSTLTYLESEFSESSKWKFVKKLDACFKQIDSFQDSFKYSDFLKVHIAQVSKQTSFYYIYTDTEIWVLFFIDHRMNNLIK